MCAGLHFYGFLLSSRPDVDPSSNPQLLQAELTVAAVTEQKNRVIEVLRMQHQEVMTRWDTQVTVLKAGTNCVYCVFVILLHRARSIR